MASEPKIPNWCYISFVMGPFITEAEWGQWLLCFPWWIGVRVGHGQRFARSEINLRQRGKRQERRILFV